MDDAGFIDEEGGALGHAAHDEVLLREKLIVGDSVGRCGFVVVVGEEFERDVFFLGPSGLCEGVIAGNAENFAVQGGVGFESGGNGAEFLGANTSEGHGDKEKEDVLLAGLFGKGDNFGTTFAECDEGKIRGLIANFDAHIGWSIVGVLRMQTEILKIC